MLFDCNIGFFAYVLCIRFTLLQGKYLPRNSMLAQKHAPIIERNEMIKRFILQLMVVRK